MKKTLAIIAVISFMFAHRVNAQMGIEIGGGATNQSGHYIAPCGCTFAFGSGYQLMGGLSYDLISFAGFKIGLRPGVSFNQFTSAESDTTGVARLANGDQEEIKLLYLNLDPYIRFTVPGTGLFVQAAPSLGLLTSSAFHHIAGSESETDSAFNPDTAINVRSARYATKFSAGYEFNLGGIQVAPILTADVPMNDLSIEQATNWKITTIYGSIEVRF